MVAERGGPPAKLVPALEALLGLWRRRYEGRAVPERSRFAAAELAPWVNNLCWVERMAGERFLIRRFGVDLIRRFGREATGEYVDVLAGDIASSLHDAFKQVVTSAAPVASGASVELGFELALFSQLVLPLSGEGGRVRELLVASYELDPPPGLYR